MKIEMILIVAGLLVFAGCKTKQLSAVDERPLIEKETEMVVEVDNPNGIMSMEERFSFLHDEDKTMHQEKSFFVIMGSFSKKENADNYSRTLRSKGFEPVLLLSESGLHRVSVGSYLMEQEARDRILLIRSQYSEHEDTWLLIKK